MKTPLLIATLLSTGLAVAGVEAADEVEGAELPISKIEAGIGYVSDDAWKFGRYNGLYREGPYIIGDIHTQDINEDGEYWSVRGNNLGLESRYFRLESGTQGKTDFFFEFDQQPNYINNTGKTPFLNPGSSLLNLPPGFIDDNLNSYLQPLETQTERQRIGIGLDSRFTNFWTFDVAYRHETKTGTSLLGGAITPDSAGGAGLLRDTTGSLLPAPVDYETDLVDVAFRYAKDKAQFAIQYHGSMFKNANDSLTWQDPFDAVLQDYGSQALPPDNQLHQLSLSGGYQLAREYNLTGVLSIGRSTQNETFQPYDTVGTNLPLPRNSLDGEVWQTNAQVRLAYRPSSSFRLDAAYRFDDRDNQTPVDNWNGVVADGSQSYNYENNPESYQHNQFDITGNWRIGSITNLRAGYQYDLMYREFASDTEAFDFDTQENKLFARLNIQPGMAWNLALYGETSDRNLNNFDTVPTQNPYISPYYIADRKRNQVGALVEYLPSNNWNFGVKAEYNIDDYDESQYGLIETETPSFTLDAAYHPSKDITTYAYYTREDVTSKQKGILAVIADVIPVSNWQADFDDSMDTFGLGGKVAGIGGKWDIGLDLVYNKSKGKIDIIDLDNLTTSPYPDLKTELASAKFWTQYNQSKNLSYRFYYWYEDYEADNWAMDDLQAGSLIDMPSAAPGEFTDYLLTGEQTQDYKVHVIGVSLVYLFP
jgi:MtrB/PioB family decaheme-associated outer membrane protein